MYSLDILGITEWVSLGHRCLIIIHFKNPILTETCNLAYNLCGVLARREQFLQGHSAGTEQCKIRKKSSFSFVLAEAPHKNCSVPADRAASMVGIPKIGRYTEFSPNSVFL